MKKSLLLLAGLLVAPSALATVPAPRAVAAPSRPSPCQRQAPDRNQWPNGTLLWGTVRQAPAEEASSVLMSVSLDRVRLADGAMKKARLEKGHLMAPALAPERLVGAIFQGTSSDGQLVEVALCSVTPDVRAPDVARYQIEVWHPESASWKNPCIATTQVPTPRALAVQGVWDESGARHEAPGRFTFACENGAIAKCIDWGYKPWAKKDGRTLKELHQACTRMARADYCGTGRSHTREDTPVDMYDDLGLLARTTEATRGWDPKQASFEAAWGPEGATCLARTRDGTPVETILAQCPGRFEAVATNLSAGDRCTMTRKSPSARGGLLRNRSYTHGTPGADE